MVDEGRFNEENLDPPVPPGFIEVQSRSTFLTYLVSAADPNDVKWDWPNNVKWDSTPNVQLPPKASPAQPKGHQPRPQAKAATTSVLPRVHTDFPWFLEEQNGIIESNGKLLCYFCGASGMDITGSGLEQHLSLERREGKTHANYKVHFFDALKSLQSDGWKLRSEGIRLENKRFYCKLCDKEDEWWNLYGITPHIDTKNHVHARNQRERLPPATHEEKKKWAEMFQELVGQGLAACKPCAEIAAPVEPPPKKTKVDDRTSAEVKKETPPTERPPERPPQELPTPHEDFPWIGSREHDGIKTENGKMHCIYCNVDIVNKEDHLWKNDHNRYKGYFHDAMDMLKNDGWKLAGQGITIKKHKFTCVPCEKKGEWGDLFHYPPHHETKLHVKYARGAGYSEVTNLPVSDPYRKAWKAMFDSLENGHAPASSSQVIASPDIQEPSSKRLRPSSSSSTFETPPAPVVAKASQSQAAAGGNVKTALPKTAAGYNDAPDKTLIDAATTSASNRHMPPLPNGLVWGYFKKPNLWMWCPTCKLYTFNHGV